MNLRRVWPPLLACVVGCVEFPSDPNGGARRDRDAGLVHREVAPPNWAAIGSEVVIEGATFGRYMPSTGVRCVTLTYEYAIMRTELTHFEAGRLLGCDTRDESREIGACPISRIRFDEALWLANALSREAGLTECYQLTGCEVGITSELLSASGCDPAAAPQDTVLDRSMDTEFRCDALTFSVPPTSCNGYRVPTASEWTYAAFGGENMESSCDWSAMETGSTCPDDFVVDERSLGPCQTTSDFAGSKLPNLFGLYDMVGNVPEIVATDAGWRAELEGEQELIGCLVDPAPRLHLSGYVALFGGGLGTESLFPPLEGVTYPPFSAVWGGGEAYATNDFLAGVRFVRTLPQFVYVE